MKTQSKLLSIPKQLITLSKMFYLDIMEPSLPMDKLDVARLILWLEKLTVRSFKGLYPDHLVTFSKGLAKVKINNFFFDAHLLKYIMKK
jgi:hypothetical protein